MSLVTTSLRATVRSLVDNPPADVDPITGKGPEWGKAAPIGLLVILLMGIATFFLLRSMTRKINKVPASFDPAAEEPLVAAMPEEAAPDGSEGTGPAQATGEATGPEPGGAGLVNDRSR